MNYLVRLFALLIYLSVAAPAPHAAGFTLALDGEPCATIVTAQDASNISLLAASELQYHIQLMTGARLPVVRDAGHVQGLKILVGRSRLTDALNLPATPFRDQEYLIQFDTDTIVLMGKDDETFKPDLDYLTGKGFPDIFTQQGTMYATYDFLERFCEVRWYLPTELGIAFTSASTLRVSGRNIRRTPYMQTRFVHSGYGYPADLCGDVIISGEEVPRLSKREQMLFFFRQRMGGKERAVNHSFHDYRVRFWEKHPLYPDAFVAKKTDWFAKGYENEKQPPQLCYTNEELVEQVVKDARSYFDQTGYRSPSSARGDYFSVVPYDNRQFCKCLDCQALIEQGAYRGKGNFSNALASELVFRFVNRVAREIKKSHPDKWIATLGYMSYGYPPLREQLEDNVDITLCLGTSGWWNEAARTNEQTTLRVWTETGNPLSLWLYYFGGTLNGYLQQYRTLPPFFGRKIPEQVKLFCESNVKAMKCEPVYVAAGPRWRSLLQSPLMGQVEFFMTWRLADDPTLDGTMLFDEFFARYYGAAAEPMKAFYTLVEDIIWDPANSPDKVTGAELQWKYRGTAERMKKLGTFISQAGELAQADLEKRRVALFEKGVWQYMRKGRAGYLNGAAVLSRSMQQGFAPVVKPAVSGDALTLNWNEAGMLGTAALRTWQGAQAEKIKRILSGKIAHDNEFLYIRLQETLGTNALLSSGPFWENDTWEVCLTAHRGNEYQMAVIDEEGCEEEQTYTAIAVDANGSSKALEASNSGKTLREHSATVLSQQTETGVWDVYLTIPLRDVLAEEGTGRKTFNLNIVRMQGKKTLGCWIPTFAQPHEPGRFGEIVLDSVRSVGAPR